MLDERASARPQTDVPGARRTQLRVVREGEVASDVTAGEGAADAALAAGGAIALPLEPTSWTRRAEPFSLHDRDWPGIQRPELPWAWIRPRRLLFLLDIAAALIALFVFVRTPQLLPFADMLEDAGMQAVTAAIVITQVTLVLLMAWDHTYGAGDRLSRIDDGAKLIKNILMTGIVVTTAALLTHGFGGDLNMDIAMTTVAALLLFYLLLTANRLAMWWWQRRMFLRGHGLRRVVVLGVEREAAAFSEFLRRRPWLGLQLVGGVRTLERDDDKQIVSSVPPVGRVLGGLSELDKVLAESDAHELVVALDDHERQALPRLLRVLYHGHLPYSVMPQLFEGTYQLAPDAELDGVPIFDIESDPIRRMARWVKRGMDVFIAIAVLAVLSPVMIAAAVAIKLSTPGPVFFRQQRVGSGGRPFSMLKFRTMCADAECRLVDVAHLNACKGPLFKALDDPRITRVGRVLRRWSIDELPQAINVLRGEMSLVGPRPPLPREVAIYETYDCVRLKCKPGITGLWQVSGRSELGFDRMVELDRRYLEHWSLRLDLQIMWRTLGAVARRRGAY